MKKILITGGSGKVGLQLINYFLKKGYFVVTTSRDRNKFLSNNKNLNIYLNKLKIIEVDFLDNKSLNIIDSFLKKNNIYIEHIIHNARSLDFLYIEQNGEVKNENFMGEFFLDVVFPYKLNEILIKQNKSKLKNIIFISSIYGIVPPNPLIYKNFKMSSPINYGVCKAAQIQLTKELSIRLAPKISVNCVSYGGIEGRADKEFVNKYKRMTPSGKMLKESDVIAPIKFLISKNLKNMTGHNLVIDGGWTIW